MSTIMLKRAYEPASANDGYRIYVDRLWPRGLSREEFHYDLWDKDLAPSTELRRWFHEDPCVRWDEFVKRYSAELRQLRAFAALHALLPHHPVVTLLYSSHDTIHNNAVVVKECLDSV